MKKLTLSLLTVIFAVLGMNAELYIIGKMTGWDTGKAQLMDEPESGVYTWTGKFSAGDDFKFLLARSWDQCWTSDWTQEKAVLEQVVPGTTYTIYFKPQNVAPDSKFVMTNAGTYNVTVDTNNQTMEVKEAVQEYPDIYMLGDGTPTGWHPENADQWAMTRDGSTYTWTGPLTHKGGKGRFFFVTSNNYWPRFTSTDVTVNPHSIKPGETYDLKYYETSAAEQTEGWKDPAFSVEEPGVYTITLTLNPDKQSATFSIVQETICIMGPAVDGNGKWDFGQINNNPFEMIESGKYQWTGDLKIVEGDGTQDPGLFRIHQKGKWSPCFGSVNDDNNVSAEAANYNLKWYYVNKSFKIASDGTYTIQLDLNADPVMSVSQGSEIVEVPLSELYMVGSALCGKAGGWSLNDDYVKAMTPTENPGEFTWTGDLYKTGGEFKFLYKNNSWDGMVAYPDDVHFVSGETYQIVPSKGNQDKKFFVDEDGKYTVLAKTYGENKTVTITKHTTDGIEAATAEANGVKVMGNVVMAEGEAVVYDAMGRTVGTIANGSLTLPAAGIYVVVANGTATKIAVK